MLSSDHKRFQWAKEDRASESTLFRHMIQKWHPTVRTERIERSYAAAKGVKPKPPASVWSPWLWIK
jgi:hypothetical protein